MRETFLKAKTLIGILLLLPDLRRSHREHEEMQQPHKHLPARRRHFLPAEVLWRALMPAATVHLTSPGEVPKGGCGAGLCVQPHLSVCFSKVVGNGGGVTRLNGRVQRKGVTEHLCANTDKEQLKEGRWTSHFHDNFIELGTKVLPKQAFALS